MAGAGSSTAAFLAVAVNARGEPWWAHNEGQCGIESPQCLDRWRSAVRSANFGWLVLMCGLNDIRRGASAAATWSNLEVILDEAIADGLQVVGMTLQPFKGDSRWSVDKQAQLVSLNASILRYCAKRRLTCVDAYAALNDPHDDGALQARYDSGDHLHFNQAGHDVVGELLRTALHEAPAARARPVPSVGMTADPVTPPVEPRSLGHLARAGARSGYRDDPVPWPVPEAVVPSEVCTCTTAPTPPS